MKPPQRLESGIVVCRTPDGEDDWPGVFIRGDNAFGFAVHLRTVLERAGPGIDVSVVRGLLGLLEASRVGSHGAEDVQHVGLISAARAS